MSKIRLLKGVEGSVSSVFPSFVIPIFLSAVVLGINGQLTIGNLIGRGELLLISGIVFVQSVGTIKAQLAHANGLATSFGFWVGVTMALATTVAWALRLSAVVAEPSLLSETQPVFVTWIAATVAVVSVIFQGVVSASLAPGAVR